MKYATQMKTTLICTHKHLGWWYGLSTSASTLGDLKTTRKWQSCDGDWKVEHRLIQRKRTHTRIFPECCWYLSNCCGSDTLELDDVGEFFLLWC